MFVAVIVPGLMLAWDYHRLKTELDTVKQSYHTKNLLALGNEVPKISGTLGNVHTALWMLGWVQVVPGIGGYYHNGMTILTAAHDYLYALSKGIEPLVSVAQTSHPSSQQWNQAVTQAGLNLKTMTPVILHANQAIQAITPSSIPAVLIKKGLDVQALKSVSQTFISMLPLITGPHPVLAQLLGFPTTARYLLIFQNSGELRSTGGFMTAYAYVPFHNGRLEKISSQNIQQLDSQVTYHPPAPTVIGAYLPVKYWHLRDTNTSPDVPQTVNNFQMLYRTIPGALPTNGMIFIDTWFVDDLIGDVGGLNVPAGHGKTVHITKSNANLKMEYMAEDRGLPANVRKLFIGTMMKELLHEVLHAHVSEILKVAATVENNLNNKQILLYFNNSQAESFAASHHWAGIVPKTVKGNYVQVVDENLLGHKDNYYVRESYQVNVQQVNHRNLETVTIHWVDPAIVNWAQNLFVPYHSWVRVYAPMGSTFVSMTGIDSYAQVTANTTLNKEVFGGHVDLPGRFSAAQPPTTGTVTVQFWLPNKVNVHRLYLQKQPGMLAEPVQATVHGVTRRITLYNNQWLTF
ncbi:MAG: DUF4012 domain-containing protein [Firmicutes bacterium]|nr:DUF4012 domain-containing protein [Bacillota bacterium]